jgi:hypothetical protein
METIFMWAGRVAYKVEYLPSKGEAQVQSSVLPKKKKKRIFM